MATIDIFSAIPRRHKRNKAINRGFYENSRLCRVWALNLFDPSLRNINRAGVVFYTFIDDKLYMCFGRDKQTNDLTDFGGTKRVNETPISCAIREANEESRYAFSKLTTEQVRGFHCLYNSNMLIIFIPVQSPNEHDIREITMENFNKKQFLSKQQERSRCYNEISEIVWLNEEEIMNVFSTRPSMQMFAKVRRFIYSCTDFVQDLGHMKIILQSVYIDQSHPSTTLYIDDTRFNLAAA